MSYIEATVSIDNTTGFWNPLTVTEFVKACPMFVTWLESLNYRLRSVALTVGKRIDCCPIHVDTPPSVNKLSWPVLNTQGTYNRWFNPIVDNPEITINHLGGKSYLNPNELKEIARMEVTSPCIINAGIPHDVLIIDPGIFPRVGLQCMLFNEPNI